MPALIACGRTWEIGSDDLFFPVLASVVVRAIMFVGLLGGTLYFREALGCQDSHYLAGFASSLLFLTMVAVIIESAIVFFSARGTIIRTKPRKPIVHLLHIRILIIVLEFVLLVIGTIFAFKSQEESSKESCPSLRIAIICMQIIVAAYWFFFFVLVLVVIIYLDPCHCYSAKVNYSQVTRRVREGNVDQEVIETQWRLSHSVWEKRFRVACCIAGSDDTHHLAYREVAEIFAHFFCDTNVVLSDIVAGLILLQKEHLSLEKKERSEHHSRRHGRNQPHPQSNSLGNGTTTEEDTTDFHDNLLMSFDFHNPEDRGIFKDGVHYLKYALGMYSWPIYVYMNPFCGLCRLYEHLNCCKRRVVSSNVEKDNRCRCYLGGLREVTGLNEVDIIYASFDNDLYKVPFMVCLDHENHSVVIAFRGTLSFGDIVTDLTASTKPIQLTDFPNFLVHKGMLKTVERVLKKLEDDQILETAFSKVNGYNLVTVGHSLGSGCACILSILLRSKYPDLRCFCYSPTGALLNEAAAIYTEEFVTSIILDKDFVARFNVPNTHQLKQELVRAIESCKKPKCQILFEGLLETVSTCFGGSVVFDDSVLSPNNESATESTNQLHTIDENEENDYGVNSEHDEENPLLSTVDPEHSLPQLALNVTQEHSEPPQLPQHVSLTLAANSNPDDSLEITPLLHPTLSSLKLPVRSSRRSNSASPQNSITQEVEQRLVPLFPPGRIIHIVDRSEQKACFCGTRQLEVEWGSRNDFNQIRVSPDMIRDHFPDVLSRAINAVWKKKEMENEDSVISGHSRQELPI